MKKRKPERPEPDPPDEELELLRRAMADVSPISKRQTAPRRVRPAPAGEGGSGVRPPAPGGPAPPNRRLLRKLRRGGFPVEEDLDLHGLTRAEARRELGQFLRESVQRRLRCVRIVHGRGWNSPGRHSVLKEKVPEWLADPENRPLVEAHASALPRDGGAGAVYVLLRPPEN